MTSDSEHQRAALIGKIAAGLAHDINGPVGVIIGFADLAREALAAGGTGPADADSVRQAVEYLDLITEAAVRARSLTRGVWTFARSRPGNAGAVDVNRAVRMAAALAAPELRGARIETQATEADLVPPEPGAEATGPVAHGDGALCAEALVEIFLSAPRALPSGGTLSWNVFADDRRVYVELAGKPYDGSKGTGDWPASDSARSAFEQQGGTLISPGGAKIVGQLPLEQSADAGRHGGPAAGRNRASGKRRTPEGGKRSR